jgi:hypothetical protein
MHVCMCMCMCDMSEGLCNALGKLFVYVCIHVCMYIHVYVCTEDFGENGMHITHIHTHTYTCVCIYHINACMEYTCIHIHINIFIHTYIIS